jgi:hypothetical protein
VDGKLPEAKNLYQEAANLNGDRVREAFNAIEKLDLKLIPPDLPQPAIKQTAKATTGPAAKSQSARKDSPKPLGESCQLIASDVVRHLERADRARGRGEYVDAERQYKDVLACEPNNDRASAGLAKTRKGQEAERSLSPPK